MEKRKKEMGRKLALTSSGPLSGKSTLAKYLEQHYGYIRADHSLTVVRAFVADWNLSHPLVAQPLTVEMVYSSKEQWRTRLQEFGYLAGFNDTSTTHWIVRTISQAGCSVTQARCPGSKPEVCPDKDVVFEPFRGEAQAQTLRELGFTLVQIEISEAERKRRAEFSGVSYERVLRSMSECPELELGIKSPDITLNGEMDVVVLARSLVFRPEHLRDERTV